jgi:hypothetical protein
MSSVAPIVGAPRAALAAVRFTEALDLAIQTELEESEEAPTSQCAAANSAMAPSNVAICYRVTRTQVDPVTLHTTVTDNAL